MSDKVIYFLRKLLELAIIIGIGAVVSWFFYSIRKRDLIGGYVGGLVVGVIGALIGAFVIDNLFLNYVIKILRFLAIDAGVNIIAGLIGAYIALYIMNRLNHDKTRKKY
jgi:uncharacterized membrane protein YeaQ/YmgE (transglycosylase-associated protein family)